MNETRIIELRRELFTTIESDELNGRVDSLEARTLDQQTRRNRTHRAWMWLFLGIGVIVSFISFAAGGQLGAVLFLGYWGGGTFIFFALRRLILDPRLDEKLPLSRGREYLREQKRRQTKASAE